MNKPAGPDHSGRLAAMQRIGNVEFDRALAAKKEILGLPDFETRADCEERQPDMLGRLGDAGVAPALWQDLAKCTVDHCARETCVAAMIPPAKDAAALLRTAAMI
jgi:hypothetical protein